jgi:hypothetical protein
MLACNTSGVYTAHTNGANQTPRTSQFLMAWATSCGVNRSHPRPRTVYSKNLSNRETGDRVGEARVKGRPIRIASVAAREKFNTDVIEITVEARQRLNDFSIIECGALVLEGVERTILDVAIEAKPATVKSIVPPSCGSGQRQVRCQAYSGSHLST